MNGNMGFSGLNMTGGGGCGHIRTPYLAVRPEKILAAPRKEGRGEGEGVERGWGD